MILKNIRFNSTETYLGTMHNIDIIVSDPTEEDKYNDMVYWGISDYSLPRAVDQLISMLQSLDKTSFPDMLRKEGEYK